MLYNISEIVPGYLTCGLNFTLWNFFHHFSPFILAYLHANVAMAVSVILVIGRVFFWWGKQQQRITPLDSRENISLATEKYIGTSQQNSSPGSAILQRIPPLFSYNLAMLFPCITMNLFTNEIKPIDSLMGTSSIFFNCHTQGEEKFIPIIP